MSKHMRHAGLDAWLSRLESLHWREIDLGLDRVRTVLDAVHLDTLPFIVITVGGTNGKGSCLAYLDSILRCCGARTGLYTSPHLLRYNERIRVDGREADDALLLDSFAVIDTGRGDTTLTYFEFGTLAALDVFRRTECVGAARPQVLCECFGEAGPGSSRGRAFRGPRTHCSQRDVYPPQQADGEQDDLP